MRYEVEQKFRVGDLPTIRRRLVEMGAEFQPRRQQVDRYFAHPSRDFASTDEALRLRRDGQTNRITYKGPRLDAATKTRQEIELPLLEGASHLDEFAELLSQLDFRPVAEVSKYRTAASVPWQQRVVEASLDEVSQVGSFVELELISTESKLAEAQQLVASLAIELGLSDNVRCSYLELLLAQQGPRKN